LVRNGFGGCALGAPLLAFFFRAGFFRPVLFVTFDAGEVAGLFGKGLAACVFGFGGRFARVVGHLAENEAGERVRSADAEAGVGMAHLLAEAVDERCGMDGGASFGDQAIGGAVLRDVGLNGFGEEPIEEVGECDFEFVGDFGDGTAAFENFGEDVGGEWGHGEGLR